MTKEMQAFIEDNIEQIESIKGYFIQLHGLTKTLKYAFQGEYDVPLSFYGTADYLAEETEEAMGTVLNFQEELKTDPNRFELLEELKAWSEDVYRETWETISGVEHIAEELFIASIRYNIPEGTKEGDDYDSLEIVRSNHIGTAKAINKKACTLKNNLYDLLDGVKLYNEEEEEEQAEDEEKKSISFTNGDE